MSVVSLEEYKQSHAHELPWLGYTVINLPLAPQAVSRTRFATDSPANNHTMILPELMDALAESGVGELADKALLAISGPGDPLARPEELLQIMELIRREYPHMHFAIRTHGIGGSQYAADLAAAGLGYIELITDGVEASLLEDLYIWIRPGKKTLPIKKAAQIALSEMELSLEAFQNAGVKVFGGITLYPLNNGDKIEEISSWLADHGADGVTIAYAADVSEADAGFIDGKRAQAAAFLQVFPSLLGYQQRQAQTAEESCVSSGKPGLPKPTADRPNVAVVSSDGMEIDMHLGQAKQILIYGPRGADQLPCLLEAREAPEAGGGGSRWEALGETLSDCFVLLAASAGENPRKVLGAQGLRLLVVEDAIEGCVDVLYGGGKKGKCKK